MRSPSRRLHRIEIISAVLLLAVTVLLFAVGRLPHARPPLAVAVGPWIGYDPLVLQRELGQLPETLRLVELPSASDTLLALRDGRLGAAAVTLDEALRLRASITDLRVFAVLSHSLGADGIVLREGLDPAAGLAGRRVLLEDSAAGGLMLEAALQREGLGADAVQVVSTRAMHLQQRWDEGAAEAVICYEPLLTRLLRDGHTLLHSSRDLPGLVYDVLVARESTLRGRPREIEALLHSWEAGVAAFARPESLPMALLLPGSDLDERGYRSALAGLELFDLAQGDALLSAQDSPVRRVLPRLRQLLLARDESIAEVAPQDLLLPGLARPLLRPEGGR